jgi:hypothetical protein
MREAFTRMGIELERAFNIAAKEMHTAFHLSSVWTGWYMKIRVLPSFTLNTQAQTSLNMNMLTSIF